MTVLCQVRQSLCLRQALQLRTMVPNAEPITLGTAVFPMENSKSVRVVAALDQR